MVTVMLIGQPDCCEKARALIDEAMDNKEEKQKQRQKEYAKKRDAKVRSGRRHIRRTGPLVTTEICVPAADAWLHPLPPPHRCSLAADLHLMHWCSKRTHCPRTSHRLSISSNLLVL